MCSLIYRYTARPGCTISHTSCSQLWVTVLLSSYFISITIYFSSVVQCLQRVLGCMFKSCGPLTFIYKTNVCIHGSNLMDLSTEVIPWVIVTWTFFFGFHVSVSLHSQGTVLTPTMDHAMSIQPTSMMGPLTQQLSHLSLGSTGTVSTNHTHTQTGSPNRFMDWCTGLL